MIPQELMQQIATLKKVDDAESHFILQGIETAIKHLEPQIRAKDKSNKTSVSSTGTIKQVIVVRIDLGMTIGKECAQVSHASGSFVFSQIREGKPVNLNYVEKKWVENSYRKIVLVAHSEEELLEIEEKALAAGLKVCKIVDAGKTQFNNVPTVTCIAIGPDYDEKIDPVTGHLTMR